MTHGNIIERVTYRVFISYNTNDVQIANQIALFLASEQIPTWYAKWNINPGDSLSEKINKGLSDCTHLLVLWSKNAEESKWMKREINPIIYKEVEDESVKIIPILLDETKMPTMLRDKLYIKYEGGTKKDYESIVESIMGRKPQSDFVKSLVKLYNEFVYDKNSKDPFGINYCPWCGSGDFEKSTKHTGYRSYYVMHCKDCNWDAYSEV